MTVGTDFDSIDKMVSEGLKKNKFRYTVATLFSAEVGVVMSRVQSVCGLFCILDGNREKMY